jgi:hypothetical protein
MLWKVNIRIDRPDEAVFHYACHSDRTRLPPTQMRVNRSRGRADGNVWGRQRRFSGYVLVECLPVGGSVVGRRSNHDEIA